MKKYNVCDMNNALIGMVLGDYLHDADGAETYHGRAFAGFAENINNIMAGYANVFFQRKNFDAAIDCFLWLRIVLRGIQTEAELTWFDKYECTLLETIAECYCFKGEFENARQPLRDAVSRAVRCPFSLQLMSMRKTRSGRSLQKYNWKIFLSRTVTVRFWKT